METQEAGDNVGGDLSFELPFVSRMLRTEVALWIALLCSVVSFNFILAVASGVEQNPEWSFCYAVIFGMTPLFFIFVVLVNELYVGERDRISRDVAIKTAHEH